MPFNSLTRLRLRSIFSLGAFARAVRQSSAELAQAEGFIDGAVLAEGRLVFWTRSSWQSEAAMKAYRDSGAHREAMPKLLDWCDEACVVHWQGEVEKDWNALYARMVADKRMSKVRAPSKAQQEKRFAKMLRWSPEQPIRPRKA
ncbi:MAG: antibiotic biosynthesis monooxygenase [Terricaulis sp.]